ncbi:MAG: AAA family ATPase [Phycisphaerales bacterium]|nr:AAA family ATPase [Phycisphaerales bacterium]
MKTTRIISLLNQKGGVGKTTTTVNLAAAIAHAGHRVLVVDLDPQTHLGLHFGIDEAAVSVYDLLIEDETTVEQARLNARPNIDLITSEVDLAAAESELASKTNRHDLLKQKLDAIKSEYDYILIDCPPSLGLLTINALAASNELIVPMQAHFLALQGVSRLFETVRLLVDGINPNLSVSGVVLCMFEGQTNLAKEVVTDLTEFFESSRGLSLPWSNCTILDPPIRRNVKLAEAPSFGQTIFDYEPECAGAQDYAKLAQSVMEAHQHQTSQVIEVKSTEELSDPISHDAQ